MKTPVLFIFTAALAMLGCDDDDRSDIAAGARNIVEDVGLQGTYESQCRSSQVLDASEKLRVRFAGNQIEQTQYFYGEEGCTADPIGAIEYEGTFTIDEMNNVDTMDVTFERVTIQPATEALVTILNGVNFCGRSDYSVGADVSVTESSGDALCFVTSVPQTFYGAYEVDEGMLWFADGSILDMETDAADRTMEVSRSMEDVFTR